MSRKELLTNKGYWIAKIQMDLYDQLNNYMEKYNLNRSQFAKKLGVTKGYVSQILSGNFNYSISKLVELSLAINKVPKLEFVELEDYIKEENTSESFFTEFDAKNFQFTSLIPKTEDILVIFKGTEGKEYILGRNELNEPLTSENG